MTREEAKEYLTDISYMLGYTGVDDLTISDGEKMLEAIEVLEQQTCNDCVSRQAVKSIMVRWKFNSMNAYLEADYEIDKLPSITPQPKIGKWEKYGISRCGEQHYRCTACDNYINFGVYSDYYLKEFKYCPICGARMIESQESEECE